MNPKPHIFTPEERARSGRKTVIGPDWKQYITWVPPETHPLLKKNTARVRKMLQRFALEEKMKKLCRDCIVVETCESRNRATECTGKVREAQE